MHSLESRTAARCPTEETFIPLPEKLRRMHWLQLIITPLLVFLNDPIDLKASISAHGLSPVNTRLSSQAGTAQTGPFCFISALAEQR